MFFSEGAVLPPWISPTARMNWIRWKAKCWVLLYSFGITTGIYWSQNAIEVLSSAASLRPMFAWANGSLSVWINGAWNGMCLQFCPTKERSKGSLCILFWWLHVTIGKNIGSHALNRIDGFDAWQLTWKLEPWSLKVDTNHLQTWLLHKTGTQVQACRPQAKTRTARASPQLFPFPYYDQPRQAYREVQKPVVNRSHLYA